MNDRVNNKTKEKVENKIPLRESIRILERKLGLLNENEMSCCGVTLAQCYAITEIGRSKHVSLNRLAEALNLDNSTMSRTVNNLVNANYAKRGLDPDDRRYVTISLTKEGKKIYEDIESAMNAYYQNIYSLIPEEKRDQVVESLNILLDALDQCECCSGVKR